jgi:hypothetical protein
MCFSGSSLGRCQGGRPATISKRTTPQAQTSALRASYEAPGASAASSGAT